MRRGAHGRYLSLMTTDPIRRTAFRQEAEHLLTMAEHILPQSSSVAALLAWHGRELLARALTPTRNHRDGANLGYEAAAFARDADQVGLMGQPRSSASTAEGMKTLGQTLSAVGSTPPGGSVDILEDRARFFYVDQVDGVWRCPSLSVTRSEAEEQIDVLGDAIRRLDM